MNQFTKSICTSIRTFSKDEAGSQVVEYALIIALVSIGLVAVLGGTTSGGLQGAFADMVIRVKACFAAGATTC